jgi:hypothetical protein
MTLAAAEVSRATIMMLAFCCIMNNTLLYYIYQVRYPHLGDSFHNLTNLNFLKLSSGIKTYKDSFFHKGTGNNQDRQPINIPMEI